MMLTPLFRAMFTPLFRMKLSPFKKVLGEKNILIVLKIPEQAYPLTLRALLFRHIVTPVNNVIPA